MQKFVAENGYQVTPVQPIPSSKTNRFGESLTQFQDPDGLK
jgi:predicted CoA-binding protein